MIKESNYTQNDGHIDSKMINRVKVAKHSFSIKFFMLLFFIVLLVLLSSLVISVESVKAKSLIEELVFENSHFIMVDDIELHYRLWQPADRAAAGNILLIHGLGGSTFSWRFVAPVLAESGYLTIAVDLPGFGLSQRKPAFSQSHEGRANLMWKLIESLNIQGPWHLVGHSMGGGVGFAMVLQKPFHSNTLTLVAGSIERRHSPISKLISQSRLLRNIAGRIIERFFLTRKRIKSFLTSAYGREPTTEEMEGYYQPLKIENTYLTLINLLKRYPSDIDLEKELSGMPIPTLGLWGREDEWVPVSKGENLFQKIPGATLILIDEAKHCPMETHPDIFNKHLIYFLQQKSRAILAIRQTE